MEDERQRLLKHSLRSPEEIARFFDLDPDEVRRIARVFRVQITPYYAGLIKEKGDALYRQVVPDGAELEEKDGAADRSLLRLSHKSLMPRPSFPRRP